MPLLPWFGQRLTVYREPYKVRGRELIIVETPLELHRAIPLSWTDWYPSAQCPVLDGQPVLFEAERLVSMVGWVDSANVDNLTYRDKKERHSIDADMLREEESHRETSRSRDAATRRGGRSRDCGRSVSARSGNTVGSSDDRKADSKSRERRER